MRLGASGLGYSLWKVEAERSVRVNTHSEQDVYQSPSKTGRLGNSVGSKVIHGLMLADINPCRLDVYYSRGQLAIWNTKRRISDIRKSSPDMRNSIFWYHQGLFWYPKIPDIKNRFFTTENEMYITIFFFSFRHHFLISEFLITEIHVNFLLSEIHYWYQRKSFADIRILSRISDIRKVAILWYQKIDFLIYQKIDFRIPQIGLII